MYASRREKAGGISKVLSAKLPRRRDAHVVAGPSSCANFVHTVLVYGIFAQGAPTPERGPLQAGGSSKATFRDGGVLHRHRHQGEEKTGQPQVILPRYGDWIFGMAGYDETAFTFPFRLRGEVVEGLGDDLTPARCRYPVPTSPVFPVDFPSRTRSSKKSGWSRKSSRVHADAGGGDRRADREPAGGLARGPPRRGVFLFRMLTFSDSTGNSIQ